MTTTDAKKAALTVGQLGEQAAEQWYVQAGYTILERNWRCFEGELDIIARTGRTIVVCEVKARSSSRFMDPALSITPAKQAKVRTAAFRWFDQANVQGRVRFDVALVVNRRVQIIKGAF